MSINRIGTRIRNWAKQEDGFLVTEWTIFFIITMIILLVLLPDLFIIGRGIFYANQVATYGVQRAAANGAMTAEIADSMASQLYHRGIVNFEIFGSRADVINDIGDPVHVAVVVTLRPRILMLMPDMRVSDHAALTAGSLRLTAERVDVSSVFIRETSP